EMENRAFLNRITRVPFKDGKAGKPSFIELEPLPPEHPRPEAALATPFAIEISPDDSTLVVSAAGSDTIFTVDTATGRILGRVSVDAVPRGIALESSKDGKPERAWVLNAVANTVSLLDLSNPAHPKSLGKITLPDPTHPAFKRGRIAFNSAKASSTRTFACASCHPDGHTDQLLWVLKTPIVTGGNQIMPRSTMPVRGLRDTAPFHWDGIPGDPYGGINSASLRESVEPNADLDDPESPVRHLIDGGLATTMMLDTDTTKNDEDKAGYLTATERDDLAKFILNITYPPAQKRSYSNELSDRAKEGFDLFHIQGNHEGRPRPNVCGDCHRMPFWVSSNTPGTGMDAPTWRGAYDRFLILPQGRLNVIDLGFYRNIAEQGIPEREMWRFSWRSKERFDPVWDMVLEGSTGFSGTFARQLTLNKTTADERLTDDLLKALEISAGEGAVVLESDGLFIDHPDVLPVRLQFKDGRYVETTGKRRSLRREQLVTMARKSQFVGTFTGRHGARADLDHPQPGLWTRGALHEQRGRQIFPVLTKETKTMTISGRHVVEGATVFVNGRRVSGSVEVQADDGVIVSLDDLPSPGMHFLQVQNPNGLFSNDFIFHVAKSERVARSIHDPEQLRNALHSAVARGDLDEARSLLDAGASLNDRHGSSGMPPLCTAAFHGRLDLAGLLIERGARVKHETRDGNTALHIASFLCREDIVKLLLRTGASLEQKNHKRETPVDVVSGAWSDELAGFYTYLNRIGNLNLSLETFRKKRPRILSLLR
ncbi:MAG: ankyrin repeat domain-containing protein, partial [Verrucomicrobiota bacterium]